MAVKEKTLKNNGHLSADKGHKLITRMFWTQESNLLMYTILLSIIFGLVYEEIDMLYSFDPFV